MGIVASLILIAFGAILTWGVNAHVQGVNVDAVGVILMVVGLISFFLSLLFWSTFWGPGYRRRQRVVYTGDAAPYQRGYGGRRRVDVVEENGPAGPPAEPLP